MSIIPQLKKTHTKSTGPLICFCFSVIHTTVLHDLWLVESADAEMQIQRSECKVISRFFYCAEGL